jgi:thiol-disulfide isomerase/thioredoxin
MDPTAESTTEPTAKKPWSWASLLVLIALVLVYVTLVRSPGAGTPGTAGPAIGRHLTYLRLEPLTGDATSVTLDDLSGRVTLVNYWGTWCPPCRREFPELVAIQEKFAGRDGFRMYFVSCGEEGTDPDLAPLRTETEQFLASKNFKVPSYADQNAATRRALALLLADHLHGFAYPTTIVLDGGGAIRGFWQGYDQRATGEMAELIEQLLAEDQPAAESADSNRAAVAPGSRAPVTAPLTATRLNPAPSTCGKLSAVIPPMAKAGNRISAATACSSSTPGNASNDFVADGNVGPTPV